MNNRDDIEAAESMSSPFQKQLCDHKQATQYISGVKVKKSSPQVS
jgi:hypothetical protein